MQVQPWSPDIFAHFGCMYSGKTNDAITICYAVMRAHRAGNPIQLAVLRPDIDTRDHDPRYLTTHTGKQMTEFEALIVDTQQPESILEIKEVLEAHVVLADEVQFYTTDSGREIARVFDELRKMGKRMHVLGLDTNHRGEPFPAYEAIRHLPFVKMERLYARCHHCGNWATHSRRVIVYPGKPPIQASWQDDLIAVEHGNRPDGGTTEYEAVCFNHFKRCWKEAGVDL